MYIYVYMNMYIYIYTHMYVCIHTYICVHIYLHIFTYMCVCVCVYIYVYTYMYVFLSLLCAAAGGKHLRIVSRYDWYEEVAILPEDKGDSSNTSIDHGGAQDEHTGYIRISDVISWSHSLKRPVIGTKTLRIFRQM